MYIHKLKIGDIELKNNILLAPMAGITDLPFRIICKKYSNPGLVCTEMVSSKALFFNDEKTKKLLNTNLEEKPIAFQIFGSDPQIMGIATKIISQNADIIDINMGCPAPKVVKNGDGSKLLLYPDLIQKIVSEVVRNTNKPVTVKLRKGWNNENINIVQIAKIIEKAGASLITIHGRTREEYYAGKVDLEIIKQVKQNVNIPVIGNGDIKNAEDAKRMFEITGVDGIMIARAILGQPWIINNIIKELNGESINEISNLQKLNIIKEHLNLAIKEKGEYIAIREMRKHICWYIKNLKGSSSLREKVNKIEHTNELIECLEEYFNNI
ncbi:MAG: tRNA dihydrouridine synthase DusB [Clostridia bacterium]|nr:tRNA dihydrouridine synthase DusB [Clostridia bacterium]